ncbi:YcdV protein [Klebsiella variicola]|nr:YcdV protein [Klebsiella variicola]
MLPTPGMSAVPQAKKKSVHAYELFLKYGGEGGLTRFARPCGAARSQARGLSNWRCQLSNPGRGFSSPPAGATCEKKARTCVRALLKIWR